MKRNKYKPKVRMTYGVLNTVEHEGRLYDECIADNDMPCCLCCFYNRNNSYKRELMRRESNNVYNACNKPPALPHCTPIQRDDGQKAFFMEHEGELRDVMGEINEGIGDYLEDE